MLGANSVKEHSQLLEVNLLSAGRLWPRGLFMLRLVR